MHFDEEKTTMLRHTTPAHYAVSTRLVFGILGTHALLCSWSCRNQCRCSPKSSSHVISHRFHPPGMSGHCTYHNRIPPLRGKNKQHKVKEALTEKLFWSLLLLRKNAQHLCFSPCIRCFLCVLFFFLFLLFSLVGVNTRVVKQVIVHYKDALTFRLSFTLDACCSTAGAHQCATKVRFLPLFVHSVWATVFLTADYK